MAPADTAHARSAARVAEIGELGRQGRGMAEEMPRAESIGYRSWLDALAILSFPSFPLDVYACGAVVRACAQNGEWPAALGAIRLAQEVTVKANVVVCNTAISACAKGHHWQGALALFHDLAQQDIQADVVSYGSLISACAQVRNWQLAMAAVRLMQQQEVPANEMTCSAAISACEDSSWRWALELFEEMLMERLEADIVVSTALMTALSFGNHWEHCLHIAADLGEKVTQTTSNALATCLQRSAQWAWVLSLLEQMETGRGLAKRCTADSITYAAAIAAYGAGGHWPQALRLLWVAPAPNAILLNVAIAACGENMQWHWSLQLLEAGITPDLISYNSAMTACGAASQWQRALVVFESMKVPPDLVTFNALVTALGTGRQWRLALSVLSAAALRQVRPGTVTYNAAIAAMEPWRPSLALLSSAASSMVRVDEVGMAAAMSVCERGHLWQQSLTLLNAKNCWSALSLIAKNALLAAFEKVDDWRSSLVALGQMCSETLQIDEAVDRPIGIIGAKGCEGIGLKGGGA
ncbi:Pentatricopeptide repeat-containing protein MRL1 [Durusdinium trenchii]|uniref:Chloroplastic (Protein MATURATION OF RBCL 1) (AtMRL1) n=1 Tax=Durusdinium trenchii TaxID=1381693 RepID=A0ABP0PAE9_9DINO